MGNALTLPNGDTLEFGGDHMRIIDKPDGSVEISFDDKGTGRTCGTCQLCCKLVPVPEIAKAAGVRCKHQRHGKGCTIYAQRPMTCRAWSCRWVADPLTAGLPRPDRCHYVIDMSWDSIVMKPGDGEARPLTVMQVWVDPAFPHAWDTPELRQFMLMVAQKYSAATIIRYDSARAFVVFPPPLDREGRWHIQGGDPIARNALQARIIELNEEARHAKPA